MKLLAMWTLSGPGLGPADLPQNHRCDAVGADKLRLGVGVWIMCRSILATTDIDQLQNRMTGTDPACRAHGWTVLRCDTPCGFIQFGWVFAEERSAAYSCHSMSGAGAPWNACSGLRLSPIVDDFGGFEMKKCQKCGGGSLHVGDRVTFAGDVPVGLRNYLARTLTTNGLQKAGVAAMTTDVVVTTETDVSVSDSARVADMAAMGKRVMALEDFERAISVDGVCLGDVTVSWVVAVPRLRGSKVLVLGTREGDLAADGLDVEGVKREAAELVKIAESAGLPLASQIRPSVGLAVVPGALERDGVVLLCASRGIPLIRGRHFNP